jgi:signal-transduction protein with cAMP-binding, CBS, and nucleotidyltransferase domain
VLDVAKRMRRAHVGDPVVIEYREGGPVPIGLVTDRDLVIKVLARQVDPTSVTAGEIMSRNLIVVSENDELNVAIEEIRRSDIRRLPVVDHIGMLVGIATLDDIVQHLASTLVDLSGIGRKQQMEEGEFASQHRENCFAFSGIRDACVQHKRRYGICIDCEQEIEYERLCAYSTAKRCARCQNVHERTFATAPRSTL